MSVEILDYGVSFIIEGIRITFPKTLPKKFHKEIEQGMLKCYCEGKGRKMQEIKSALEIEDPKDYYLSYD